LSRRDSLATVIVISLVGQQYPYLVGSNVTNNARLTKTVRATRPTYDSVTSTIAYYVTLATVAIASSDARYCPIGWSRCQITKLRYRCRLQCCTSRPALKHRSLSLCRQRRHRLKFNADRRFRTPNNCTSLVSAVLSSSSVTSRGPRDRNAGQHSRLYCTSRCRADPWPWHTHAVIWFDPQSLQRFGPQRHLQWRLTHQKDPLPRRSPALADRIAGSLASAHPDARGPENAPPARADLSPSLS